MVKKKLWSKFPQWIDRIRVFCAAGQRYFSVSYYIRIAFHSTVRVSYNTRVYKYMHVPSLFRDERGGGGGHDNQVLKSDRRFSPAFCSALLPFRRRTYYAFVPFLCSLWPQRVQLPAFRGGVWELGQNWPFKKKKKVHNNRATEILTEPWLNTLKLLE